jgi:AraC-like DNA-binding protein
VPHPRGYDFGWSRGRILHEYQILFVSQGAGWFESKTNGCRRVRGGTVFLLFPGVWHRYRPDPQIGWSDYWIGFDGSIARNWVRSGFFSPRNPLIHPVPGASLLNQFSIVMETIRINQPALQQVLAGLISAVSGLLYSAQQSRLTGLSTSNSAIQEAIERMQAQSPAPPDFAVLARELGVSYSWFRRTFTEHTGLSPHQYWLEVRMAHARNLLAQTKLRVKQIARDTGFENEHYFCRLFRKRNTMTPSQWRHRAS